MRPLALIAMLLCGCAAEESVETCDGPTITWETFGHGFVTTHCQGCHASTAIDRQGAPVDIVFDTEADVIAMSTRVLDAATSETPRMPPAGGPTEEERALAAAWLGCFIEHPE
jgi:uncharacterized membrane protein